MDDSRAVEAGGRLVSTRATAQEASPEPTGDSPTAQSLEDKDVPDHVVSFGPRVRPGAVDSDGERAEPSRARAFWRARRTLSPAGAYPEAAPVGELAAARELRVRPWSIRQWWRLLDGAAWPWLQLAVDVLALTAAIAITVVGVPASDIQTGVTPLLAVYPPLAIALMASRGLYSSRRWASILDLLGSASAVLSILAMGCITVAALLSAGDAMAPLLTGLWLSSVVCVCTGRTAAMLAQRWSRASRRNSGRALIVGAGVVGARIAAYLDERPEHGLEPVGVLDSEPFVGEQFGPLRVVGSPERIVEAAASMGADHVILAFPQISDRELVPHVSRCEEAGLKVSFVPRLFESINERIAMERLGTLPLIGLRRIDPRGWQFALKYWIDRVAAAFALIVAAPVMLLIAAGVKLTSPGPVLFRQRRVGLDGRVFDLLKFRSMYLPEEPTETFRPALGFAPGGIEGTDRRSPLGKLMRRTFLDELPQLINVLRGDMSLIGPRPERPEFVELFAERVDRYVDRHRVKSGITGWAQVNGLHGQTSLERRIEFDNYYIHNWSPMLDLKIVLLTVAVALSNRGE
jgi:exopolysaccharide biosynthesis polyprenyl glycosylphosphotransferase